MSDCSTRAWNVPECGDQVWRSPSGREIHLSEDNEPHEIELTYPDQTHRYLHYAGDLPVKVKVDGIEYKPAELKRDEDWTWLTD